MEGKKCQKSQRGRVFVVTQSTIVSLLLTDPARGRTADVMPVHTMQIQCKRVCACQNWPKVGNDWDCSKQKC